MLSVSRIKKKSKNSPRPARKRSGGVVYKGKLPKHVKKFTYKIKGRRRVGYISKITNKRIAARVIRKNRASQAAQELFPKSAYKTKKFLEDYNRQDQDEREFMEGKSGSLFDYIRQNNAEILLRKEEKKTKTREKTKILRGLSDVEIRRLSKTKRFKAALRIHSHGRKSTRGRTRRVFKQSSRKSGRKMAHRRPRR